MFDFDQDSVPSNNERLDWLSDVKRANFKDDCKDYRPYRLFGKAFVIAQHQLEWMKDGTKKKFTHLCPKLNPDTGKLDRVYGGSHPKAGQLVDCPECNDRNKKPSLKYLVHAIDRTLQAQGAANPVVVLRLPESAVIAIFNKKKFNVVNGTSYALTHAEYGCDVWIKVDFDAKNPAQMYLIETGQMSRTPLTQAEQNYPTWDLRTRYENIGFRQADPDNMRQFMERVGLLAKSAAPGTQMFTGSFGDDDLPQSFGGASGPAFGASGAGFGGGSASTFVPPTQVQQAFTPPSQPVQVPAAAEAQPSSRFSVPVIQDAPAAKPDCFRVEEEQGTLKCKPCPVRKECFA